MAFASMFLIFFIFTLFILFLFFVVGIVLLIIGIIRRKKDISLKKKTYKILLIIGSILLIIPLSLTILCIVFGSISVIKSLKPVEYNNIVDKWRKLGYQSRDRSYEEIMEEILVASDNNDKETLMDLFAVNIKNKAGIEFENKIDKYLENYPKNLSEFNLSENSGIHCSGSYNYGDEKTTCSTWSYIYNGDERYYFYLDYIPADDMEPENVGIQSFALYSTLASITESDDDYNEEIILANMKNDPSVKIIYFDDRPVIYNDIDRNISYNQMIETLNEITRYSDFEDIYGEANSIIKNNIASSTEATVFYKVNDYNSKNTFIKIDYEKYDRISKNSLNICIEENLDKYICEIIDTKKD